MKAEALLAALVKLMADQDAKPTKRGKGKKAKGRPKMSEAEKAAFRAENDANTVVAFTKAGYKDVQPRINVLTYGKEAYVDKNGVHHEATGWIAKGRKVKKGEKAIHVTYPLFHVDQTEPLVQAPAVVVQGAVAQAAASATHEAPHQAQ